MRLRPDEKALLEGKQGPGLRRAMEIVLALGRIYGAEELTPIVSAQVAGVSYGNLGEAGLAFLEEWAAQGARVRVLTTLNPAGMDLERWREMGIPEEFARAQQRVVRALVRMGALPTLTCAPYLVGNRPEPGQHLAWSESSAVAFANSVLGARTNREGGPSALAAAIVGRTARYGLHLTARRRATHLVEVRCPLRSEADFGALGYMVGREVREGIPYFRGLEGAREMDLRALGAAMAASGAVALFHVEGLTPEAPSALPSRHITLTITDLREGYAALSGPATPLDLVWIGCPHASAGQIRQVAEALKGRRLRTRLWVTTARHIRKETGKWVEAIEEAGGKVVADTCLVVAPLEALGFRNVATNSAKGAFYLSSYGLNVRFGSLEQCLEAAVKGKWDE